MKKTSLHPIHVELGAKMVEFAGWEMPVQYEGVRAEHMAVRNAAGIFDVSHMGEIEIRGKDAPGFCQWITTNDVYKMNDFQAQYTLFCNHSGGVVDDVILYKFQDDRYLFCVNAANATKDYEWLINEKNKYDVEIIDRSPEFSQIAIQGPDSESILSGATGFDSKSLKRFRFGLFSWNGIELIIARTGYTGEDGFEVFMPWNDAETLWRELTEKGQQFGIKPCGLGSRDTLRLEMGYSLYGHEIDEDINPLEAGLERYVKMEGEDFLGKDALLKAIERGLSHKVVGFVMIDRGIPRQGYGIFKNDRLLGNVTSGTLSPCLEKSIGIGYLRNGVGCNERIHVEIRNSMREAETVNLPFYRKDAN